MPGPRIVQIDSKSFVETASFLNVDYTEKMIENRFSSRLLARISAEEYQRRVLAAARVHWILSGGTNVAQERVKWLFLSFRSVSLGDPELQSAQNQGGHIMEGPVYRVETCFLGDKDPSIPSPKGPRFKLVPLKRRNFLFVTGEDSVGLRRREEDPQWSRVAAE